MPSREEHSNPSRTTESTRDRRPSAATLALVLAWAGLIGLPAGPALAQGTYDNQDAQPSRWARYSFPAVGLADGQSLRVSVFTPPPTNEGEQPPPTNETETPPPTHDRVRVQILAASGQALVDSGGAALPPGPVRFITVPREKLDRPGEEVTGRLQVRVVVLVASDGELPPGPVVPSVEVLNTANGRTTVVQPPPVPERY
jgi:hypothetical protein